MKSLQSEKMRFLGLYSTQFLSALADNMILFVLLKLLNDAGRKGDIPIVQGSFFVAFIVFSFVVGAFADKYYKSHILLFGNAVKILGVFLFLLGVSPVLSYFVIGVGAVIYSPGKYGILPELTTDERTLHKANSIIEGLTILSILLGTVLGGIVAAHFYDMSFWILLFVYGLSILFTFLIPKISRNASISIRHEAKAYGKDILTLLRDQKTRFALIGSGSFWMVSAILRLTVLIWLADVLGIVKEDKQSLVFAAFAVGIIIGSAITPFVIPMTKVKRTVAACFALGGSIAILSLVHVTMIAIPLLVVIGMLAGMYFIPMNTIMQLRGKELVGSGKTISIQNLVNNAFMVVSSLALILFTNVLHFSSSVILFGIGVMMIISACLLHIFFPKQT